MCCRRAGQGYGLQSVWVLFCPQPKRARSQPQAGILKLISFLYTIISTHTYASEPIQ